MTDIRIAPPDKITHIVEVFTHIHWPLPVESVDRVIHDLGWTRMPPPPRIHIIPDFEVSHPYATFLDGKGTTLEGNGILEIDCWVSDSPDESNDLKPMRQAYKAVRAVVVSAVGQPMGGRGLDSWWDLPTGGRIHVKGDKTVVALQLLSKIFADTERDEVRFGISPDRVLGEDD